MKAMQYAWGSLKGSAQDRQKWIDFVVALNNTEWNQRFYKHVAVDFCVLSPPGG